MNAAYQDTHIFSYRHTCIYLSVTSTKCGQEELERLLAKATLKADRARRKREEREAAEKVRKEKEQEQSQSTRQEEADDDTDRGRRESRDGREEEGEEGEGGKERRRRVSRTDSQGGQESERSFREISRTGQESKASGTEYEEERGRRGDEEDEDEEGRRIEEEEEGGSRGEGEEGEEEKEKRREEREWSTVSNQGEEEYINEGGDDHNDKDNKMYRDGNEVGEGGTEADKYLGQAEGEEGGEQEKDYDSAQLQAATAEHSRDPGVTATTASGRLSGGGPPGLARGGPNGPGQGFEEEEGGEGGGTEVWPESKAGAEGGGGGGGDEENKAGGVSQAGDGGTETDRQTVGLRKKGIRESIFGRKSRGDNMNPRKSMMGSLAQKARMSIMGMLRGQ
eukprot:g6649.t1